MSTSIIPYESIQSLPNVLAEIVILYLRYADYSDSEIRSFFSLSIVIAWRKISNVKDGMANGVSHSVDDQPLVGNKLQQWYKNGELHRDGDLPANINRRHGGDIHEWYKEGKIHREGDKPAYINGVYQIWYKNGIRNRDNDLPCVINGDIQEWYKDNKMHREGDKPAFIGDGIQKWYKNGQLHRDGDKPALINENIQIWFINGKLVK